ncbi:putative nuclease HARBI1 [Topomyia yanbarensis]|uniref:putative nuclease HARBI1 n=1 Tax=Topomyia yanbarensis TaxID=2498891 RepID=UPI00273CE745|nr:putative nuclease HARBI1 [Topomyia yanbarensis]
MDLVWDAFEKIPFLDDTSSSSEARSESSTDLSSSNLSQDCERIKQYAENSLLKSDIKFKKHYRMSKQKARFLMAKYKKDWNTTRRPPVPIQTAVLTTIWWLANKSTYRSSGDRFDMSRGLTHSVVLRFCKILYGNRSKFIRWPREDELRGVADNFKKFPNVIGAIDGTHVEIPKPRNDDSYNNRKLTQSIQVQLVCNAKKQFLDVFCGYPGSVHDARVWRESPLYAYLNSAQCTVPNDMHLVGDSAYPLDTFLLRPYKDNGNLSPEKINFNKVHSSTRMVIENAIGLLKGGIFNCLAPEYQLRVQVLHFLIRSAKTSTNH